MVECKRVQIKGKMHLNLRKRDRTYCREQSEKNLFSWQNDICVAFTVKIPVSV